MSYKSEAKTRLNNKRRTYGMKAIDKAIRNCDIDFEKDSYFILKYGKYSETIPSEGEAMHKFKKAKEQFGSAELVVIKNGKVSRKYN